MNVLIVEDEKSLATEIALFLKRENFLCDMAHTGRDASEKIAINLYDFILLDLGLPDYNGLDLISEAKSLSNDVSFIIITARGAVEDRVKGLDLGADDYIPKPFSLEVLTARIQAQLRRTSAPRKGRIDLPPLHLDYLTGEVLLDGREINLTKMELQLLGFFATNVGVGATQAQLLTSVWRSKADIPTNTVRQTVSSLRRKLALDAGSAFELEFSADKRYVFRQVRFDPSPT